MDSVIRIKERYQDRIMKKGNVVGVGVGHKKVKGEKTDTLSIVVLVEKKLPLSGLKEQDIIPRELDGVYTDVQEIGIVEALNKTEKSRTDKWRPAPGGVSIGHYHGSSGTLGISVMHKRSGEKLILSCNHVLAHANECRIGDPVLQPGPFDGGRKQDEIAELYQYVPLTFLMVPADGLALHVASMANVFFEITGSSDRLFPVCFNDAKNTVDAALGLPLMESLIEDTILNIGKVEGTKDAQLGMVVEKSGRTTGYNKGKVDVVEATIKVHYGNFRSAVFNHQVITGLMSKGGDSGSVITSGKKAVGLLFAGSERSSVFNPMGLVLDALNVDI